MGKVRQESRRDSKGEREDGSVKFWGGGYFNNDTFAQGSVALMVVLSREVIPRYQLQ